jgi:hypothetical protein
MTTVESDDFEREKIKILAMTRREMCACHRFSPCVHPYFDSTNALSKVFGDRFKELGGFSPEISKEIGW